MERRSLRNVLLYLIVMSAFICSLLFAMTAKAEGYTCQHLETAMASEWGRRMAAAGARAFLRDHGGVCVVASARDYTDLVMQFCLDGHKLEAAKSLALTEVVCACELLAPEKEIK
jgi:hypothetical protein